MIVVSVIDGAGVERVHATHIDAQRADILAHPDYAGHSIYSVDGDPACGSPLPAGAVLLNPPLDLYRYAATKRKALIEAGTVMVGGVPVPTDETTRNFLAGAGARIASDPSYAIADWKISDGVYVPLDSQTILAIAHAVADHVQLMFSRNRAADEAIAAGTATTTAQVDAILEGA